MRSATNHVSISTARADALFASALQCSDKPSAAQAGQAIAAAIREFGARGCAARVAQAYGEHPETAVLRMRWARAVVTGAFETSLAGIVPTESSRVRSAGDSHSSLGCQSLRKPIRQAIEISDAPMSTIQGLT